MTRKKSTPSKRGIPTKKRVKAGTSKVETAKRRKLFVEAYIQNGGNATQAAISAGYSDRSARSRGAELVADRDVQKQIETRRAETIQKAGLTTEGVLEELRSVVHSDLRTIYRPDGTVKPPNEWPDEVARAVSAFEVDADGKVKVRLWDKNSALEKAMRSLGMFKEDNAQRADALSRLFSEISGKDGVI